MAIIGKRGVQRSHEKKNPPNSIEGFKMSSVKNHFAENAITYFTVFDRVKSGKFGGSAVAQW